MITKMTRYSMILLSGDMEPFMKGIQQLGMVDITRSSAACDDTSRKMSSLITRCRNAVDSLGNLTKENPDLKAEAHPEISGEQMLSDFESNAARRMDISTELASLEKKYRTGITGERVPERPPVGRIRPGRSRPHQESRAHPPFLLHWRQEVPEQMGAGIPAVGTQPHRRQDIFHRTVRTERGFQFPHGAGTVSRTSGIRCTVRNRPA